MANDFKEKYLIDTNILVYSLDKKSPFFVKASAIIGKCLEGKIEGVVAQQNLIELVATLTGTYKVAFPSAIKDAESFGASLKTIFPRSTTFSILIKLLENKRGADIFDYYLAATMIDNGIKIILTRNVKDFKGIKGVEVVNPWGSKSTA